MAKKDLIQVMIKPVSSSCNMDCAYCFYKDEERNRSEKTCKRISDDVIDALLSRLESSCINAHLMFQGGEPTLASLDFYKSLLEKEKSIAPDVTFYHSFQTNGLLIDDKWASFFHDNNFLVGLSFDGGVRINDIYRLDSDKNETSRRVLKSALILERNQVRFNVLVVVTKEVADNVNYVWQSMRSHNFRFQQYIPVLPPLNGEKREYELDWQSYLEFLKKLFDFWFESLKTDYVSIRLFEDMMDTFLGFAPESCELRGKCGKNYVLEADGSVYPCDFYCLDEYCLGSILTSSFSDLDKKRKEIGFCTVNSWKKCNDDKCYMPGCFGGCKRYHGKDGSYFYCQTFRNFTPYMFSRVKPLLETIRNTFGSSMSFTQYLLEYNRDRR